MLKIKKASTNSSTGSDTPKSSIKGKLSKKKKAHLSTSGSKKKKSKKEKIRKKNEIHNSAPLISDSAEPVDLQGLTYEIGETHITKESKISTGPLGDVWKGLCRKQRVAIKVLHPANKISLDAFREEINVIYTQRNPNILYFYGACTIPPNVMLVTEWIDKDLHYELIINKKRLPLWEIMRYAKDIAKAIHWMHSSHPPKVHGNLRLTNFRMGNTDIKVCDGGLRRIREEALMNNPKQRLLHLLYTPPEVLEGPYGRYTEASDVFVFGLCLWEMINGELIYSSLRKEIEQATPETTNALSSKIVNHIVQNITPTISRHVPDRAASLLKSCWSDPEVRPGFGTIIDTVTKLSREAAIEDPSGRYFWSTYFTTETEVPWNDFLCALCSLVHQEAPDPSTLSPKSAWAKLKLLLCHTGSTVSTEQTSVVTLQRFGEALKWFGPLLTLDERPFLTKVADVIGTPWFHGDVSKERAVELLGSRRGSFLVRFSTEPGSYTISRVDKTNVRNNRIELNHHGYYLKGMEHTLYPDMYTMVTILRDEWGLLYPAAGSKYFVTQDKGDYNIPKKSEDRGW
eukprot:TRINITY_DN3781_c0_g2_i3.p1 TRINITY_DN3781_c0_g2~~TRINITY_DN3781_c0_g2_i3.p1  ORF type:complete len:570 (+),score=80.88 TRINITY_DN3781_c0_g2_i3:131-1840(+)